MKTLLRAIAVLFVLIAAFLVYAVIHAVNSAGGARAGVAVAYIVGAILLALAARALWRRPARPAAASS
jgi:multisubunit Na+/H+ antiporter MnhB subunit